MFVPTRQPGLGETIWPGRGFALERTGARADRFALGLLSGTVAPAVWRIAAVGGLEAHHGSHKDDGGSPLHDVSYQKEDLQGCVRTASVIMAPPQQGQLLYRHCQTKLIW